MKNKFLSIVLVFISSLTFAQQNVDDLLAAGVNDARRFTNEYLRPAGEGMMYSMNHGWFNSGKSKKIFGFEISLIANAAFVNDKNQSFVLNPADYENLDFRDNPGVARPVATAFGDIEGVIVRVEGEGIVDGIPAQDAEFELPTGLGSEGINLVPTAFLQVGFGLIKGTEIKVRYFPKVETNDTEVGFYGAALQHEFTKWLPADKVFPVAISGLIAYTHLDASYDFTDTNIIDGDNQRFENNTNTWLFQLIGSTKLPIFNVYGGLGYLTGNAKTDLKGTYRVQSGVVTSETITDPFSIENKVSGVRGTVGAKLSLAFFRFNVDYTIAEYSGLSVGLNFGI